MAAERSEIGYHPFCGNVGLTHLSFAYDILVFTDLLMWRSLQFLLLDVIVIIWN